MDRERLAQTLMDLCEVVTRLRGPGGCPWDAEQTDDSIKIYLLEEAYEVLEAVEERSPADVMGELGDLLFQIIFLSKLAEEREEFDLADVMAKIKEKMINRHPHVFGETKVSGPKEVSLNWDRIKKQERSEEKDSVSVLESIPRHLPALLRAHRLSERAAKMDLGWKDNKAVWIDVERGMADLKEAFINGNKEEMGRYIGDLLFTLVNLSRLNDWNAEDLLRARNQIFLNQCGKERKSE